MVEKCCHVEVATPLWLHKNKGIWWGGKGYILATILLTFVSTNNVYGVRAKNKVYGQFLHIKFLPQVLLLTVYEEYLVLICNCFLLGRQQFLSFTCWKPL